MIIFAFTASDKTRTNVPLSHMGDKILLRESLVIDPNQEGIITATSESEYLWDTVIIGPPQRRYDVYIDERLEPTGPYTRRFFVPRLASQKENCLLRGQDDWLYFPIDSRLRVVNKENTEQTYKIFCIVISEKRYRKV